MIEALTTIIVALLGAGFAGILILIGLAVVIALILKGLISLVKFIIGDVKIKKIERK